MPEFTPDDYVYPECGCHISRGIGKIAYCPLHDAAPRILKELMAAIDRYPERRGALNRQANGIMDRADAVFAKDEEE